MERVPIGRRAFLALSATSLLPGQTGKGATFNFPPQRFLDASTEFDLLRLTDPQYASWLPAPHLHFISRRGRFLIHSSDRSGRPQIFRLDWHTGESRQLTGADGLDGATPALSPEDRFVYYFDGTLLRQITLANLRDREIDRTPAGWDRAPGFSLSSDGSVAVWVERQAGRSRLRAMRTSHGAANTILETAGPIVNPQVRPGQAQVLYRRGGSFRLVNIDGRADHELRIDTGGSAGQASWGPNGSTLLYLSIPADTKQLIALREIAPEQSTDKLIAKTSQFASFGINGDASVFVGASRNRASPYLLLLLRAARRELTLCEHRDSDPLSVEPVFSPDSQSIFFMSDRKGKRAIYRAHVEKFVEETE